MTRVHVVATGVANTASVCAAFARLECETVMITHADEILRAEYLVLPGVGAFTAGMAKLRERDWAEPLRRRVADARPTLAICLGMQLLGSGSEESGSVESGDDQGLGVVSPRADRFSTAVRVPHMGWNRVEADPDCAVVESGFAYFAHSYRWTTPPPGWLAAYADHGAAFVAAAERGAVVACQFHPELSGEFGSRLLRRFLRVGGARC
jgi:imidazole glycerol-phosphate synthase subunit HisH